MANINGNAVIGQSGGPTCVINESLVGAILESAKHEAIGRMYGARHGLEGLLTNDLIDLTLMAIPGISSHHDSTISVCAWFESV